MRAFLMVIMAAMLLGGCAAKPTVSPVQAVSTQAGKDGAGEDYDRAIADYNNCVLEHTSNVGACDKQQAMMNRLGKVSSRASLDQSYQTTPTNTAGITQGAHAPARIPLQAITSRTPAPMEAPLPTTSLLPEQIPPPPGDRPITQF